MFHPLRAATTAAVEGGGLPTGVPGGSEQVVRQNPVSSSVFYPPSAGNGIQKQPAPLTRHGGGSGVGDNTMPLNAPSLSIACSYESLDRSCAIVSTNSSSIGGKFLKSTESFKV